MEDHPSTCLVSLKAASISLLCAFSALVGWSLGLALTSYEIKVTLLCNMQLLGKNGEW
jgi:hypothetical protein